MSHSMIPKKDSQELGPQSYENWLAFAKDELPTSSYEYPLTSDAYFQGGVTEELGPYELINTVAVESYGRARTAVVLRIAFHQSTESQLANLSRTPSGSGSYHGGSIADEVAALVALALGVRLKAGPATRLFLPGQDCRGVPIAFDSSKAEPVLLRRGGHSILPSFSSTDAHNLGLATRWSSLPKLPSSAAIVLIRAARQYQDAVWLAESEPSLAWLLLVSAIETAATYWHSDEQTPIELLTQSKPDLANYLRSLTDYPTVLQRVATDTAHLFGSTKKFCDFLINFCPEPPSQRPTPVNYQVKWTELTPVFGLIYKYRSNALHGGTPFPLPMCQPPMDINGIFSERPAGIVIGDGGKWSEQEAPISLHLFEYIVRCALLKWSETLATTK